MTNRPTKSSEYIRHTFTPEERLKMGDELAQAFNRMADIETEESVLKAQIKERKSQVEQTISKHNATLRDLGIEWYQTALYMAQQADNFSAQPPTLCCFPR